MKYIIFPAILVLALAPMGCKTYDIAYVKKHAERSDQVRNMVDYSYDGVIWIKTYSEASGPQNGSIEVEFFRNKKKAPVNAGKISVGKYEIAPDAKNYYNNLRFSEHDALKTADIVSLTGTDVPIKVEGNESAGIGPVDEVLYVPAVISRDTKPGGNSQFIVPEQDFELTWVPDKKETTMMIELRTEFDQNNFSKEGIDHFSKAIADNGKYTIPWKILKQFNQKRSLQITLYRYSMKEVKLNKKKIALMAYSRYFAGNYFFAKGK